MAHKVLATTIQSISEFRKDPMAAIVLGGGDAVAILNANEPVFYVVPAAAYEKLVSRLSSKAATPEELQAALMEGSAGVKAALKQRTAEMQALDKADREGDGTVDPYAITMSNVGQTAGAKMERHWNVPAQSFDNRPVSVASAPAQNGVVPVPWNK